jgi:hypothetical protein
MATKIQVRRDTSANWTSLNPTLSSGEIGYETNTGKFKIGNGSSLWLDLDYFLDSSDLSGYLTSSSASTIYLTQVSASTTYLAQDSASTTYLTQDSASTTYLTQESASANYLTQASASTNYLTQESASTIYATKNLNIIAAKTASYILSSGDEGSLIQANGTLSIVVPFDSEVNFAIGTQINLLNIGTGVITIDPRTSFNETISLNATPGLKLRTQWSSATLIKRDSNTWVLVGDLTV